jgi:2-polyprenyl-6-hydroxyphenyl methylase/3-demethylubiquinone-9 3-methyltransferase
MQHGLAGAGVVPAASRGRLKALDTMGSIAVAERAAFYERFADEFDDRMNRYEVGKRLRLVFDDALGGVSLEGRTLLDAGCGTGLFSAAAAARGARVTSLDVGERLLEQVARKTDSERVVGDVASLPFADDRFDFVVCTEVIEHTMDPHRAVNEVARVLAPGGTLVLTTPNRVWHPAIRLATKLRLRPYEGIENWVRFGDLRAWLTGAGIELRRYGGFNALPFVHPVLYRPNDRLDRFGDGALGRFMINIVAIGRKRPAA